MYFQKCYMTSECFFKGTTHFYKEKGNSRIRRNTTNGEGGRRRHEVRGQAVKGETQDVRERRKGKE